MLSNNTSVIYNDTNQTGADLLTDSDRMKLIAFWDQLVLAEKITLIIFAIFTIPGNTLVLVVTWRERSLHQPNKYFIACLAVADLFVGVFSAPLVVYSHNIDSESQLTMSIHLYRFMAWIHTFVLVASIFALTFISFDRYFKISKPLQYKSRMTTSKSLKIIFIIWLISRSIAFATYAATPHSGSRYGLICSTNDFNKIKGYYTFLAVSVFFLPTTVILVMYALVFDVVRKRQKMLRNGDLFQTCNDWTQRRAFLQDLKAIRMLLVVVGVFILCWGPYFIYILLLLYYPNLIDWDTRSISYLRLVLLAEFVIAILPYFNSFWNHIIYACLDQTYREAFKNVFQRMISRTTSRRQLPPNGIELPPQRTT